MSSCVSRLVHDSRILYPGGACVARGERGVGRGVTPHQHWRRRVGRIENHDRCLWGGVLLAK
jgi:hypothetical protein